MPAAALFTALWAAIWTALWAAPGARAQEVDSGAADEPTIAPAQAEPAGSLEVSAQLWAVIARYRFGATADRVRVTLAQPSGRSDMLSLVIRCVPGAAGLARIELGDVVLGATHGRLTAVHEEDPTTYAVVATGAGLNPADVLRVLLPPLPIPQLSLAFDPGDVDWCPLVRGVRWESAVRIGQGGESGIRLSGSSEAGPASLELIAGRVRRFEAILDAATGASIIVEAEPVEPGNPDAWALDTAGRRRVDSLADLRPLGPPLTPGERWPETRITAPGTRDAAEWPPAPEGEAGAVSPELRAAWLFRADLSPESLRPLAERALAAVVSLRREILRGRIDGRLDKRLGLREVVAIALVEQEGDTFEQIEQQRPMWEAAVGAAWRGGAEAPSLAWTPAEARLLDRVAPGAPSALVLLDGRGVILAAAPIDESTARGALEAGLISSLPATR